MASPSDLARELSQQVLLQAASTVDGENRFPSESFVALRNSGLMSLMVPESLGGMGGSFADLASVASELGAGCLSTALIWGMHAQQTVILADAGSAFSEVLLDVVERGSLIASVTTEARTGADLFEVEAALERDDDRVVVQRAAPIVSYGREAEHFLITMRASPASARNDVRLVLVSRNTPGSIEVTGEWNALGVKGTQSVPMEFDVTVEQRRVLEVPFREVALRSMVPAAHVAWSAAWLGAARGAFQRFLLALRSSGRSSRLDSNLSRSQLAEIRLDLGLVASQLGGIVTRMDALRRAGADLSHFEDPSHILEVNNLKIAASRLSYKAVDDLIEFAGMAPGFLKGHPSQLERILRDLRSASLMYSNERLLQTNGRIMILESSVPTIRPALVTTRAP